VAQVLDGLAGLLLSGGGDIHPSYYGEEMAGSEPEHMDAVRDEFELELTREALARDMPVLGICRGIQVLNVALGGGLAQHVPGHRVEAGGKSWVQHRVHLAHGSRLATILGVTDAVIVNSHHHQAVTLDRLAEGLVPAAYDDVAAGLLEAVESPAHRWVIGVQWHPERDWELPQLHQRLFHAFLEAMNQRG
jgi:gamma-glutamyl-gamma-aminobutyrate hydrolase PuuD